MRLLSENQDTRCYHTLWLEGFNVTGYKYNSNKRPLQPLSKDLFKTSTTRKVIVEFNSMLSVHIDIIWSSSEIRVKEYWILKMENTRDSTITKEKSSTLSSKGVSNSCKQIGDKTLTSSLVSTKLPTKLCADLLTHLRKVKMCSKIHFILAGSNLN